MLESTPVRLPFAQPMMIVASYDLDLVMLWFQVNKAFAWEHAIAGIALIHTWQRHTLYNVRYIIAMAMPKSIEIGILL